MKKITGAFFALIVTLSIAMAFTGCKTKAPWEYSDVEWYSESPVIELHTEYAGEPSIGFMEVNGQQKSVYLWWGPPTYTFSICEYDSENGVSFGTDKVLLQGKVKYNSVAATLLINTDNVFDSQYSVIVLSRRGA